MLNQDESNLYCIVYLSSATNLMTDAEIEALLVSARNSNAAQNITGVLMYLDGNFVQCIEAAITRNCLLLLTAACAWLK